MKGKVFYIRGYHRVVFCHKVEGDYLILGGLTHFVSDSKTNILRQEISIKNFKNLKPKELDESILPTYSFLYRPGSCNVYCVKERPQHTGFYLSQAIPLPSEESTSLYNRMSI